MGFLVPDGNGGMRDTGNPNGYGPINNTGSANNYGAGSGYRGGGGVVGSPMDFLNNSSPPPYSPSSSYWNNTGIAGGQTLAQMDGYSIPTNAGGGIDLTQAGGGYAPNQAPAPVGGSGSGGGGGFFTGGGFDFGDLFNAGLDYYQRNEEIGGQENLGNLALQTGQQAGRTAAEMAKFQPYTVTGNLATGRTTAEGGLNLELTPEELERQQARFGQAEGLFGQVGVDPAVAQRELYEQIRSVQRPEEERERLRMQEGLFSGGRGGISQAQYGGSNQEQFGFDMAQAEARNKASLAARTQALAEQNQALDMAGALTGYAYQPQQEAISMFGAGNAPASYADAARRQQGSLYGESALKGLEGMLQAQRLANDMRMGRNQDIRTGLFGSGDIEGQATQSLFDYGAGKVGDYLGNAEWNPFGSNYQGYNVGGSRSTIGGTGMTSGGSGGSSQAGAYTGGGTGMSRGGDADNDGVLNVSDRYPLDPTRS